MRYNTHTWMVWMLLSSTLAVLTFNPLYHVLLTLALLTMYKKHNLDPIPTLKAAIIFSIPLLIINILFVHHGKTKILEIPRKTEILGAIIPLTPIAGPITIESISAALVFMILLVNMLLIFSLFNSITSPDQILRLLPKRLSSSTLLVAITLRFIPTITANIKTITEAQKCRGLKTEGNKLTKLKNNITVLIPTIVNSLERSYNLAEALESRAYSRDRTRFFGEKWRVRDKVLTLIYISCMVYLVSIRLFGHLSFWDAMSPLTSSLAFDPLIVSIIALMIVP